MYKVFLIEDDCSLSNTIKNKLEDEKYTVNEICDFHNYEKEVSEFAPHVILLDVNLPYLDGFIMCKKIRKISSAKILMISARNTEAEQIFGIEQGADDYLVKPFSLDMLKAKVYALIRQIDGKVLNVKNDVKRYLHWKGLKLDTEKFTLVIGNDSVELSKNELKLIKAFFESEGKVITRGKLNMLLWDDEEFVDENTLNVNVKRLKDKLSKLGYLDTIKSKRGLGYYLDAD